MYNETTLKCEKRPVIYISTNFTNILTTPTFKLPDYKAEIVNVLETKKDSIVKTCTADQYSNYSQCLTCKPNELFNIKTKKCMVCTGKVNATTQVC